MMQRMPRRHSFLLFGAALLITTAAAVGTAEAQRISLLYYRGICSVGAVGPCHTNTDCDVAGSCVLAACVAGDVGAVCVVDSDCNVAGVCNINVLTHSTTYSWSPPGVNPVDVYQGDLVSGRGTLTPGVSWNLDPAPCFAANIAGGGFTKGPLGADHNPSIGAGYYYVVSEDGGIAGLPNINFFGCARPGICNNAGWCELGASPGTPCNVPVDCPGAAAICAIGTCTAGAAATLGLGCNVDLDCGGGGVCQARAVGTICSTDAGGGDVGGCALHAVCDGGANIGRLCAGPADCPSAACPPVPSNAVTPGQICYNQGGPNIDDCPPIGNAKRLIRVVPPAVIAACP